MLVVLVQIYNSALFCQVFASHLSDKVSGIMEVRKIRFKIARSSFMPLKPSPSCLSIS